jgi:hypothetical protein
MTYIPALNSLVSTANSTIAPLAGGATFTGTPEEVSQYASISVSYYLQPPTATGNIMVQFSNTSSPSNWIAISNVVSPVDSTTSNGFTLDTTTTCQYFRVVYLNDSTAQTSFTIQTIFHPQARIAVKTNRLAETMTDYTDCVDTRSFVWGKTLGGGKYEQVATNGDNSLVTTVIEPRTAFGAVDVSQDTPTCQVDFIYGINNNLVSNTLANGGQVGWFNGMANVTTAATLSSSATLTSVRYVRYRTGQGVKARFTGMFTAGVAGNTQLVGIGDGTVDGLFFGFNGTSFGILYKSHSVDTWYPQTTWNIDKQNGAGTASGQTLDPTKLNVFQVKYQYLGGGNMFFYVLNSQTGRFDLVHIIRNANTATQPNFRNPSMNFIMTSYNSSGSTAVCKVSTASVALFVEGVRTFLGPLQSEDAYLTAIPNLTLTSALAIRNASSLNGIANRAFVHLRSLSVAINGGNTSTIVILRLIKNYSAGPAVFVPLDGTTADQGLTITGGNSCVSSNIQAPTSYVTISGGKQVFSTVVSATSIAVVDLTPYDISLFPGETLSFAAFGTGSTPLVGVTAVWNEDI